MKILVDENIPFADESFGLHGEVVKYPGRQLSANALAGVDALITRSVTRVNAGLFAKHSPGFVGTCTIGTDHLDIPFLESSGIAWAYAPGCNAQSVVDYVLSVVASLRGDNLPESVGIAGCGNVGGLLRRRMLSMGVNVRVYDPFLSTDDIPELCTLDQVFQSELVCLHTPYTESGQYPTQGMIGKQRLEYLPANALLISAGRGGVLREDELLSFMQTRADVQVACDVWQREPCINPVVLEAVDIATPHIAGYSIEGKRRGTAQIYKAFCEHFSLPEQDFIEAQPVDINSIESSYFNCCSDYLLSAYDPKLDMYRMRNSYLLADEQGKATGTWFDELRRSYPERREIASYRLDGTAVSDEVKTGLMQRGYILF